MPNQHQKHSNSYGTALKIVGFCTAAGVMIAVPIHVFVALGIVDQYEEQNHPFRYSWNRLRGRPGIDSTQRTAAISAGVGAGLLDGGVFGTGIGMCGAAVYGSAKLIGYAGSRLFFGRPNTEPAASPAVLDRDLSEEKRSLR